MEGKDNLILLKYQINQIQKEPLRLFGKSFVKLNKYRYRIFIIIKLKKYTNFLKI